MADVRYEIVKKVGTLSETGNGWSKQLNLVSWNGREPKYDLRDWSPDQSKMSKGVTMTAEEVKMLHEILKTLEL